MEPEPEVTFLDYWFGFRRAVSNRRTGLLIFDRTGVYSTARRRYIHKSRYHRYRAMTMDLAPLVKAYRSLQKLGMNSWPEHDKAARKEITLSKHRVMDLYWDAMSKKRKARAIERYFRARYQRRMVYPLLWCVGTVIVVGTLLRLMFLGRFTESFDFDILELLLALCLIAWVTVVMTEGLVTVRWVLTRSQIHDVLEFELSN